MDAQHVPQDNSKTYAKMEKAIYAAHDDGKVKTVSSTGWEVEEIVATQALDDIEQSIQDAYVLVQAQEMSPLYYHMYASRMDLAVLSQSTGFFQWTVKRDFKPNIFSKINQKRLLQYCDVLGVNIDEIKLLPKIENE